MDAGPILYPNPTSFNNILSSDQSPSTSLPLAFHFPFPPKREDPEKRHTGNPVRHNYPKTLLMSRGQKPTNADPNLESMVDFFDFPVFCDVLRHARNVELVNRPFLNMASMYVVGIRFG